ncbi:MAG: BMP family protein [Bariatricus sp.]
MKAKRMLAMGLTVTMMAVMAGCGGASSSETESEAKTEQTSSGNSDFSVAMVTDTAGINDQSFNQSAWEGLQELGEEIDIEVNYLESKQASDYVTNLERLTDNEFDFIWSIGSDTSDALLEVAEENPDVNYAIVDSSYENTPDNVVSVLFKAEEPSFLVGYVAALSTQTNKVGFVGGIENAVIQQFMYGYEAGVAYGAKELGKEISVDVQFAESFSDAAKGKAIASKMFSDGCDVVYQAAGGTGTGVIEAAKEAGKYAIGVDRDQSYLAPDNILTSALKKVGTAIQIVSKDVMDGKNHGGETLNFGLAEGCVGIPEENPNMNEEVYNKTMELQEKIQNGEITVPGNTEAFEAFVAGLN